ncbi:nucleoside-diphosphate sugar epimerase [Enterococcus faecium]|uniref:Nucleoside-diphosphate sugar epimerase n=1 Tax=Enterococcus faecium (strain ATCC BAA-472 / TX0016 / DO) TaxID=333849 RepID=Q3XZM8_ENTFD|nr:nucleoside-diphosphate sugar epimerase [Enterococcus faecium]AFK59572.1 nucleoside-diphosphate sugar epimerase [Enterococcus faecium DO]EAN09669.1 hypothetical protein EfaeDRAFT_1141 [Enterococcus faecium DO]
MHIRSFKREFVKVSVTNILGFLMVASVLFIFHWSQFSRLLLLYFYIISTVFIVAELCIFDYVVTQHELKNNKASNILLIGNDQLAIRFYHTVISKYTVFLRYVGYIAEESSQHIQEYRGTLSNLPQVITAYNVEKIIVTEDTQNIENMQKILAVVSNYHIKVCVGPVYTDLISTHIKLEGVAGLQLIELQMFNTCNVMGLEVAVTDVNEAIGRIFENLNAWKGHYICIADMEAVAQGFKNSSFQILKNQVIMTIPSGNALKNA